VPANSEYARTNDWTAKLNRLRDWRDSVAAGTPLMGVPMRSGRSQSGMSLVLGGLGIWLAWVLGGWVVGGNITSVMFVGLGVAVCAITVLVLRDWRKGFYAFLAWLLFEDLFRKYLGNNMAIYFGKDVLVGIVYLSFFISVRRGETRLFRPPYRAFLMFFFWWGVLECFNPRSPSIFYGILGLKLYFYYIPIVFVGYALIRNDEDLRRFLSFNMLLAGVISLLGIIQAVVGVSFLNPRVLAPDIRYLSTLHRYSPLTGLDVYRPPSVFVSDGRFAWYLMLVWLIGLGAVGYLVLKRRRGQTLVFVSTALVGVAVMLCGSRGTFVLVAVSSFVVAAGFIWGAPWRWGRGRRLVMAVRRGFIAVSLGMIVAFVVLPSSIGARWAFYSETLDPTSPASELYHRTSEYPLAEMAKALPETNWFYGSGIGTASLGMQYVSRILGQPPSNLGVESGYGDIIIEFGLFGLLLWILWTAAVVISCWKVVLRVKQTAVFPIAFALFWFISLLLFPMTFGTIATYENYIYNAYLWLLVGILFRLPGLELHRDDKLSLSDRQLS
jgi:hypothetical protein